MSNNNQPNLAVSPEVVIVLLARDHTLIISNAEGVIFKCTVCGGTKDVFFHGDKNSYPWMRTCFCGDAGKLQHAPNAGGDAQQLLTEFSERLSSCQDISAVRALLIDLQYQYQGGVPA